MAGFVGLWILLHDGEETTYQRFKRFKEEGVDSRGGCYSVVDEWKLDRQRTKEGWMQPLEPNAPTDDPLAPVLVSNPHPHP